ncbi:MAG: chromosome segregation protein [Candidatus Paceibacteria bacterium]|jgi:chromosome segregation protein
MRLKRLELLGFKSFADLTTFEFGDDTLTGIVGPNGCGKSNVVDAMRWVLGEQRAKSMRGKDMTDVIFKGCASRPGMGVAECTIVLDNSGGTIETHGAEISITRRVFKSGEGEYRIDGQKVRLKDIKEMLFDTGLGSRGYSVLEQGRIDAVLSANAIDRRRIFEEAAGISRYRQRKHETELRLARVHQDLERIEDVTGELRTRVRSLKIQAGKAERYVEARGEWEGKKTRLVKHQLHRLGSEFQLCLDEIGALEQALEAKRLEREGFGETIGDLEQERSQLTEHLDGSTEILSNLEGDARALDERRTQLLERVRSWQHIATEEAQRVEDLSSQLSERSSELEVLEEQRVALGGEAEAVRTEAQRRRSQRDVWFGEFAEFRRAAGEQNGLVLRELHAKTNAQNTLRHLEDAQGPAGERAERIASRLQGAVSQLGQVQTEEEQARGVIDAAQLAFVESESARDDLQTKLNVVQEDLQGIQSQRSELELDIARRTSHIESLLDRERELADLGAGAKAVLAAASNADGDFGESDFAGLIADHLSISTEYARALDAVLGERSAALVLRDARGAQRVADWLTERAEGQAALSVVGGLGQEIAASALQTDGIDSTAVLGSLRERIQCSDEFAAVADSLCGNVWLVRDLKTALALVRSTPGVRCVTPRGELVDGAGLVAGERTLAQGAIGRRSSAAELQAEVSQLTQELDAVSVQLEAITANRRELQLELHEAVERASACRHDVSDAAGKLATCEARVRDLQASRELSRRENESVQAEVVQLAADLVLARTVLQESEASHSRESSIHEEMEAKRGRLEQEREELTRAEGESQVDLTRVEQQIEGLVSRIADLKRGIDESHGEVERAKRLSEEAGESANMGSDESSELAKKTETLRTERDSVAVEVADLKTRSAKAEEGLEERRRERDEATRLLEGRATDLSKLRLDEQRISLAQDEIARRAEEELKLEVADLLHEFEPEEDLSNSAAVDFLDKDVREIKLRLDRMGPVNMEALGELDEVSTRLDFLDSQIGDLTNARKVLNDTLKKIEEESERLFVETFNEVRVNFQRIFRQLFGGGKADVRLAEGEPVLEAGVEISARPPGREMLPIGLLSGGQRTMTALALLFAVFEARPSPFCVLDEVDAALDDANIQRFLLMLDQFRQTTQFVVVTHNKGTMARCEGLYGVTMQTKGVSRQVSVQLDEVDEFVPEVQGKAGPAANSDRDLPSLDADTGEPIKEIFPANGVQAPEAVEEGTTA